MSKRPVYMVEVHDAGEPVCLLETRSINIACNFLKTVNLEVVDVRFLRHHPFFEYDVDNVLEVLKDAEV